MTILKYIWTYLVIASFAFSLSACDQTSIAKAEKASARLASYADRGVNATRDIYRNNVINVATKDQIARGFIKLAEAGMAFDVAVSRAKEVYGSAVPQAEVDRLFTVFDATVVAQFLNVLASMKLISDVPALAAVIDSIKVAVLVIADAFGKKVVVQAQIA